MKQALCPCEGGKRSCLRFEKMVYFKPRQNVGILKRLIIAIDGPAASGKSTTAKLVASQLGYLHVDTGAMYRAMTLKVIEKGIDVRDEKAVAKLAKNTHIALNSVEDGFRVKLDGVDVTDRIRRPDVTGAVSAVSMVPEVRHLMVKEQREMGKKKGIVLEGRDIGTVVFPEADIKIFMIAHSRERAVRRSKELAARGIASEIEELEKQLMERDKKDTNRSLSPLTQAEDAIILDTTNLTIQEQVDFIVKKAKEKLN
jgi:CMP/dCMP kinase